MMSWYTIKDEGIVLRSFPFREADRRYRILTLNHGKIDCLGRGAQKQKAKLAPSLEPFGVIDVEIIRGRRSTTVISTEKKQQFWNLTGGLERRLIAQSSLRLIDRFTHEFEQDPDLYHLVKNWLSFINHASLESHTRSTFVLGGFLMRLLEHFGYQTQLIYCLHCKEEIMPLSYRWHGGKGGLVCTDCIEKDSREWFAVRQVQEDVIKLLRFARHTDFPELMKPRLTGDSMSDFANIIHDLITFHIPGASDLPFWRGVLHDAPLEKPIHYR